MDHPSFSSTPVFYRRNLPHWHPGGAPIFLTWRLQGSLPTQARTARNGCATEASPGREFRRLDALLDRGSSGPLWLKNPRIAALILQSLRKGARELHYFVLHAFVIMPNHIHLLITPHVSMRRITNGLKGSTAREANIILGRTGGRFWQDESFDHWVRSTAEFARIWNYIELNPVTAQLVTRPQDWPWSSAKLLPRHQDDYVRPSYPQ